MTLNFYCSFFQNSIQMSEVKGKR